MIQMSNQHNDNYCSEELRASEMKSKERWTNERAGRGALDQSEAEVRHELSAL